MINRRTFLMTGVAGGVALFGAWWWRGAHRDRNAAPGTLAALDAEAPAIVGAIVPALLAGALPADPAARAAAVAETVANVERAIAGLPPAAQGELGELFALLGLAPARVALAGVSAAWAEATPDAVNGFLDRWRASRFALLRSAYDALHQLVFAAWYGNPRSWPATGYGGPPALLA
jgi:hypothetical protein